MTRPRENDPERGLMRMLREALRAGLAPDAGDEAFVMARASAQIIGLYGLDAALEALEPYRGRPWRGPALEMADFVERLLGEEDLSGFRAGESDFRARAEALREWRVPVGEEAGSAAPAPEAPVEHPTLGADDLMVDPLPPAGAMSVEEALADLPLAGDAATGRATRVWLTAPVAAGLRAALEWLTANPERPRPFRLRAEDSVLEATCENVHPEGLFAAHHAIAEAGGNIAPVAEGSARAVAGAWTVRVPAWSPRPVHLMLEQGDLRLAVPWHAVLRVSLVPTIELEMRSATLATPVLTPLAPLHAGVGERPVVAVAHGLRRGLLVADRLVWRLGTETCAPSGPSPVAGLRETVRSVENEEFWVADPGMLLAEVAAPLPPTEPRPRPKPPAPDAEVAPPPAPSVSAPESPRIDVEAYPLDPVTLSVADVEPIELSALDIEPLPLETVAAPGFVPEPAAPPAVEVPPAPPAEAPAAPVEVAASASMPRWVQRFGTTGGSGEPAPAGPDSPAAGPAVLIAEDSIAARHFLQRLFERRGLAVHVVDTVAALREVLGTGSWSLVCADVDLPDADSSFLAGLRAGLDAAAVPLVALVRDDEDAGRALDQGVRRWLRKPFDFDEVDHLLTRLGLLEEPRS